MKLRNLTAVDTRKGFGMAEVPAPCRLGTFLENLARHLLTHVRQRSFHDPAESNEAAAEQRAIRAWPRFSGERYSFSNNVYP